MKLTDFLNFSLILSSYINSQTAATRTIASYSESLIGPTDNIYSFVNQNDDYPISFSDEPEYLAEILNDDTKVFYDDDIEDIQFGYELEEYQSPDIQYRNNDRNIFDYNFDKMIKVYGWIKEGKKPKNDKYLYNYLSMLTESSPKAKAVFDEAYKHKKITQGLNFTLNAALWLCVVKYLLTKPTKPSNEYDAQSILSQFNVLYQSHQTRFSLLSKKKVEKFNSWTAVFDALKSTSTGFFSADNGVASTLKTMDIIDEGLKLKTDVPNGQVVFFALNYEKCLKELSNPEVRNTVAL